MRRILPLLLAMLLLCGAALAEPQTIDLETMTFEELAELSRQVQLAIFESDGWQEVEVPKGTYQVGVDIPAGHWMLSAVTSDGCYAKWGTSLDEYKVDIPYEYLIDGAPLSKGSVHWQLIEGTYLYFTDPVLFSAYTSPVLGFK